MPVIDISKDYPWTVIENRANPPVIFCQTFDITDNQIYNAVQGYQTAASSGGLDYYEKLHAGAKAKDQWVFPFFSDEVRGFTNEWGDTYVGSTNGTQAYGAQYVGTAKQAADSIANTIGQTGALAFGKPGALFEPPKFYTYGVSDNSCSLEFTLINTFKDGDEYRNFTVIKKLIEDNRFSRTGSYTATPPVLWQVHIPGYRFIRWASCNVGINLIGRRELRQFGAGGGRIAPEGYRVSLTFTSLYTEPREFAAKF